MQGYSTIKLNSAARKVAADLEYARHLATAKQVQSGVSFAGSSYSVYEDYGLLDFARDPERGGNFVVDYTTTRYQDFSGVTLATTMPGNVVQFNSLGAPLDNTGTAFAAQQTVTATLGASSVNVCIVPNTGRAGVC